MSDNETSVGRDCSAAQGAEADELTRGVQPVVQRIDARCPEYPHSEEYALWCECNACPSCEGLGEDFIEDEWNEETQDYGKTWVCSHCDGTGIDPAACEVFEDYED